MSLLLSSSNWTVYGGIYKLMLVRKERDRKEGCWRLCAGHDWDVVIYTRRSRGCLCVGGTLAIQLSSLFLLSFSSCLGVVRPSQSTQTQLNLAGREMCDGNRIADCCWPSPSPIHPWMIGNRQVPSVSSSIPFSPLQMSACSKPPSGSFDFFVWSLGRRPLSLVPFCRRHTFSPCVP